MVRYSLSVVVLTWTLFAGFQVSRAQDFGGISATGNAEIVRSAQRMRLNMDLIAQDSDIRKAGKALNERIEIVKKQLAALKAIPASIEIGPPKIQTAPADPNQQIRMMMMAQQLGRLGKKAQQPEVAPQLTVTARLQADWELPAGDPVEIMAKSHDLQQAIREANLSGAEEDPEEPAEDQEALDAAQMFGDMSNQEAKPGEPLFVFLTPISQADRDAALVDAFVDAKRKATELANAANAKLGELRSLNETSTAYLDESGMGYNYNSPAYQVMQLMSRMSSRPQAGGQFAMGADPTSLKYNVQVMASFALAK